MAVRILEIKRERCPAARFIGKKYENSPNWDEWWENGWFAVLEANQCIPFNGDAYLGGVRIADGMPERWIGMLFPAGSTVPEGFDHVDVEPLDFAVCYLYGKDGSGEFYTMDTHNMCLDELKARGLARKEDDWCFERYSCPRFTTPDESGCVILDYAISILA